MGTPRNPLAELDEWLRSSKRILRAKLEAGRLTSPELEGTRKAIEDYLTAIREIENDSDTRQSVELVDSEITRLFALNRFLRRISHFLMTGATAIQQHMATKQPWPGNFEVEFDIDALIAYWPRRDDPAVQTGDASPLANRELYLKARSEILVDDEDWNDRFSSDGLGAEPHCWLFHDLYDHGYGLDSPALSFHDCLRVGEVRIDLITQLQMKRIDV